MKSTLAILSILLFSVPAMAELNGKPVILIHGFQPDNLLNGPQTADEIERNGANYFANFWSSKAEYRIDWDSNDRIEGRTAERAYDVVMQIAGDNACHDGCVIITHSTGDIVTRYVLDNQEVWTRSANMGTIKNQCCD